MLQNGSINTLFSPRAAIGNYPGLISAAPLSILQFQTPASTGDSD
ncbi:hypothetical protein A671_01354 [Salmonella enterica subsp. enterica serovar Dublin str. DG22]|uniref:Uncharacterized protein n=1 Tax=Salmonella enterica subsp. enterica serovar Dublin str. UC16 TaxID=1192688 RepID=M7RI32_SALDU|nr:hypothetical protein A670_03523 [Salmonella enterica subsp. enterica serovar Dublin str. UC16]EPI73000.1 hypothetical protein A671_01354 [Salmonella enterica subsp. enterica serovar Dublin str. DG22]